MCSANLPGQPNKFPIGKGKICIAASTILLGKLSPQYYWVFCSFVLVLFFNFLSDTLRMVSIYFVADRDISRQICSHKAPRLQVDCCLRNTLSTFHLKKKRSISCQQHTTQGTHCRKHILNPLFAAAGQLGQHSPCSCL